MDYDEFAKAGRLNEVWWLELDPVERLNFYHFLLKEVPKIKIKNGMQEIERHIQAPEELIKVSGTPRQKISWRFGAEVLRLGELQAAVEGDPPSDPEIWQDIRSQVLKGPWELLPKPSNDGT